MSENTITGRITVHWGASIAGLVALHHKVNGRVSEMILNKEDLIEVYDEQITIYDVLNTFAIGESKSYYEGAFAKVHLNHFSDILERKKDIVGQLLDGIKTNAISGEEVINSILNLNTKRLISK